MKNPSLLVVAASLSAALAGGPAEATTVSFTGTVINMCVLTVTVPGLLGLSGDGTTLSSQGVGGLKATMTVVAAGTNPTISFSAPSLTGPAGSVGGATKMIGYTSLGGANQALTTNSSSYIMSRLIDTLAIDGAASNAAGFGSGSYTLASTATCQQ